MARIVVGRMAPSERNKCQEWDDPKSHGGMTHASSDEGEVVDEREVGKRGEKGGDGNQVNGLFRDVQNYDGMNKEMKRMKKRDGVAVPARPILGRR